LGASLGACTLFHARDEYAGGPAPSDDIRPLGDTDADRSHGEGLLEASTRPEDVVLVDPTACDDPCDCDEDGLRSSDASCPAPGRDCEDLDPFVPHDGFVADMPVSGQSGDWDCSGKVEKQYTSNLSCGRLLGDCNGEGFSGDPSCGESGEFVVCAKSTGGCVVRGTEIRTQGCR
jgi:hypothetical protein